jgi:hypothetical protein
VGPHRPAPALGPHPADQHPLAPAHHPHLGRNFGFAIAHAYAGHTDGTGDTGSATSTYVRATLTEVATALAALTGEPHPLAEPEGEHHGSAY